MKRVLGPLFAGAVGLLLAGCGGGAATWAHDPANDIGPDTTTFVAWVTETACAGGRSSEGRVLGPDIELTGEAIIVTFQVQSGFLEGLGGNSCPSNPATRVEVDLPEPLGDRVLLDGGLEPPGEPPVCTNQLPFCG